MEIAEYRSLVKCDKCNKDLQYEKNKQKNRILVCQNCKNVGFAECSKCKRLISVHKIIDEELDHSNMLCEYCDPNCDHYSGK